MVEEVFTPDGGLWTYTDENLAMLVDRLNFWLSQQWSQWTVDPDDPEVQRAHEERKRAGVKPPPEPILVPVAQRPPEQAEQAWQRSRELREKYSSPDPAGESNISALDRALGG